MVLNSFRLCGRTPRYINAWLVIAKHVAFRTFENFVIEIYFQILLRFCRRCSTRTSSYSLDSLFIDGFNVVNIIPTNFRIWSAVFDPLNMVYLYKCLEFEYSVVSLNLCSTFTSVDFFLHWHIPSQSSIQRQ